MNLSCSLFIKLQNQRLCELEYNMIMICVCIKAFHQITFNSRFYELVIDDGPKSSGHLLLGGPKTNGHS